MKKAAWVLFSVVTWVLSSTISPSLAQDNYPTRPIRLVVGFPPGAAADVAARLLAQRLAAQVSVNVIVDNRSGGNAIIATEYVARANPDGYTLLFNTPGVVLLQAFDLKLGYDLFRDLAPIGLVTTTPLLLDTHPSVPVNTVGEFMAYLKANPDKLAYGSTGTGNLTHLANMLILQTNNLTALHVPYKSGAEVMISLVGGSTQFALQSVATVSPMATRVKILAITGLKRSPLLPNVPTMSETIMPGFEVSTWTGVIVPAKAPPAIVRRLSTEMTKALQDPDMKAKLAQENIDAVITTPTEYGAYLKSELERWTKVIKSANIKLE